MKTHRLQGMHLATLLFLSGCTAALQSNSSGESGCNASEISISDYRSNSHPHTWTAKCRDKTYQCSGSDMLKQQGASCRQVSD